MEKNISYQIECDSEIVVASHGATLLESLNKSKIYISQSCGGHGTCGTCLVHILSDLDKISAREPIEQEMASERGFASHERLACQLPVCGNLKITIK